MFNLSKIEEDKWTQRTISNTEYNCNETFGKNLWKKC